MTAAAVGPLAPRGLPGLLWHHGCEQGDDPRPALYSCPHSRPWRPGQTPNPVLPSVLPVPVSSEPHGAAAPQPRARQPSPSARCCSHPRCQRCAGSWAPGPARPGQTASCRVNRGKLLCAGLGSAAGAKLCVAWAIASFAVPHQPSLLPLRPQQTARLPPAGVGVRAVRCGPCRTREGFTAGAAACPLFTAGGSPDPHPLLSTSPVPGCVRDRPPPGARRGGGMGDGSARGRRGSRRGGCPARRHPWGRLNPAGEQHRPNPHTPGDCGAQSCGIRA